MSRNPQQQRLIAIIDPVCQGAGFELVDVRFVLEQGGWILRVFVDLPLDPEADSTDVPTDRVDLSDCENLSRELGAVLDVEDPIPQAYSLEVSSPGIDRPLRTAAHFAYFAGSEAKVQLAIGLPVEGGADRKNFRGILRGVVAAGAASDAASEGNAAASEGNRGDRLKIEVDGKLFELPIEDVDQARLVPDWDAVMRGKSGAGDKQAKPIKPGHPGPGRNKKKSSGSSPKGGSDAHD